MQRATVYNNFPTERQLFAACQAHFLAEHPRPDPEAALTRTEPAERLRGVLEALYGWYRTSEAMVGNVQRDRRLLPELDAFLAETSDRRIAALPAELANGFAVDTGASVRTRALIGLALEFATWQRLAREGLSDSEGADVMVRAAQASGR